MTTTLNVAGRTQRYTWADGKKRLGAEVLAPAISAVSGAVTQGTPFTVSGSGFGSAPSVAFASDFTVATVDQSIPTSGAIGSVSLSTFYPALAKNGGLNGGLCATGRHEASNVHSEMTVAFSDTTELFVSYAVKIPAGHFAPSSLATVAETWPTDSCWKMTWIKKAAQTAYNDLCLFTHNGTAGRFNLFGNDYNYWDMVSASGNPSEWWVWDDWIIITAHLKAGANPKTDNGTCDIWITNQAGGRYHYQKTDAPIFDNDGAEAAGWDSIVFSGWQRDGAMNGPCQQLWDQMYVAAGSRASARVEISDNAVYDSGRKIIQKCETWGTGSISSAYGFELGDISAATALWLWVTTPEGQSSYKIR